MKHNCTRREFLKDTAIMGAAVAAMRSVGFGAAGAGEAATAGKLPMIKLGSLEVSRLILGSNPFFGFDHGNPQGSGKEMKDYYTDERIVAVLDEAAEHGITAVWSPCYDRWIALWNKYRKDGGKLRHWIGQPDNYGAMKEHIKACADNGGSAICIQGVSVDRAFHDGKHELVREWLELIRSLKLPAGMASHFPNTHLIAEEKKLPTDFYHQCLGQPENYTGKYRDEPLETMRKLAKPVVGYKVLGAGRLKPRPTFEHVLRNIKPIDGICVGVFPKTKAGQIAENVALAAELSKPVERA